MEAKGMREAGSSQRNKCLGHDCGTELEMDIEFHMCGCRTDRSLNQRYLTVPLSGGMENGTL